MSEKTIYETAALDADDNTAAADESLQQLLDWYSIDFKTFNELSRRNQVELMQHFITMKDKK